MNNTVEGDNEKCRAQLLQSKNEFANKFVNELTI